jgi:hypothetical protein
MSMRRALMWVAILGLAMAGGGISVYVYLQHLLLPPQTVNAQTVPTPAPAPETRQVLLPPPAQPPLPQLSMSDRFMLDVITDLLGGKSLLVKVFRTDRIIHNFVATIDNLPSDRAPLSVMPIVPAAGAFKTFTENGETFISPDNAKRYAIYMKVVEIVDPEKLVAQYVRLYPLFQQAYEELGYPKKYFNDRLLEALDDLLDAPEVNDPVKLSQPHVLYQYADPDIQSASIGQRILVRLGSRNEAIVKAKLVAIRQELRLQMHSEPVTGNSEGNG